MVHTHSPRDPRPPSELPRPHPGREGFTLPGCVTAVGRPSNVGDIFRAVPGQVPDLSCHIDCLPAGNAAIRSLNAQL